MTGYGTTKQKVSVGDIVLVQDDMPQINLELAMIVGHDNLAKETLN